MDALRGRDFQSEAALELLVVPELRTHHFDCHGPSTVREGQVYPPHPARAEPGANLVAGDIARIVAGQRVNQPNPPASSHVADRLPAEIGPAKRVWPPERLIGQRTLLPLDAPSCMRKPG